MTAFMDTPVMFVEPGIVPFNLASLSAISASDGISIDALRSLQRGIDQIKFNNPIDQSILFCAFLKTKYILFEFF